MLKLIKISLLSRGNKKNELNRDCDMDFGEMQAQPVSHSGNSRQTNNIVGAVEMPRLTRMTDRLLADFAKTLKSDGWPNFEPPPPSGGL